MSTIQNLIAELKTKLSPRAREELDRVVHSPEAEALFQRENAEVHAERTELTARLAALPKQFAGQHVEASKKCAAAAERETEAEDQLQIAKSALRTARHAAEILENEERRARWGCEHSLRESADPRLAEFAQWCNGVADLARGAWSARPVVEGRSWITGLKGGLTWATNGDSISAACSALKAAADDSRAAQLQVLTRQDVSDRLNGHLHKVGPILEPMRLLNCEINAHGDLVFDRTKKAGATIKDVILATGQRPDPEPGDTPPAPAPKVYARATSTRRAQQALDRLAS